MNLEKNSTLAEALDYLICDIAEPAVYNHV